MLNKVGHCSSYDDVEVINTGLARDIKAKADEVGVVVPSIISPGVFVQFAVDNNDLNEETPDGKQTTHARHHCCLSTRVVQAQTTPKSIC